MSTVNHNLNNNPVGFFDSGVGGLSVYSRFKKLLPNENTLYYGDLANLPYGNKSKAELIGFARNILDFYKAKNVKAVVIACNTSSAQAYETVKNEYDFQIFPIIQSCAEIIAEQSCGNIGVFATEATVYSHAYAKELTKYNPGLEIFEIACPNWVSFVESGSINSNYAFEDIKSHMQAMLSFNPQKIILGCTHYPYLINILKKFAPAEKFIDPAEIFAEYIKNHIDLNCTDSPGNEAIYVSASPESFKEHSKIFYNVKECCLLPKIEHSRS